MFSVEECRKYLKSKNLSYEQLSDKRVEIIRDYLYAICNEAIRHNIRDYKKVSYEQAQIASKKHQSL